MLIVNVQLTATCSSTKHIEWVVAFPLQKWRLERSSIFRCTFILVWSTVNSNLLSSFTKYSKQGVNYISYLISGYSALWHETLRSVYVYIRYKTQNVYISMENTYNYMLLAVFLFLSLLLFFKPPYLSSFMPFRYISFSIFAMCCNTRNKLFTVCHNFRRFFPFTNSQLSLLISANASVSEKETKHISGDITAGLYSTICVVTQ